MKAYPAKCYLLISCSAEDSMNKLQPTNASEMVLVKTKRNSHAII